MGDILHALHAVTALRQAHPGWVIDWVVEPRWRALLTAEGPAGGRAPEGQASRAASQSRQRNPAQPIVNQIHLAATRDWRKSPFRLNTLHEIRSLRKALRNGGYDVVLDLQGAIRSAILGRMAGCRRVIGEAEPRERAARWLFTEQVETHGAHVIERGVELASSVAGDDLQPATPWLPVDPTSETWADRILPRDCGQQAVLINPGAGWGAKRWPVERYTAVAQGLIDRGFRVVINAGPGEEPLGKAIVQAAGAATPVHCSLEQLIALSRRVALAIAGDTGPLHLACALGRPVVGIYGPTDPSRNGPFGTKYKVLRSPESRSDHTRHAAPEAGMMTIQAKDVLRAADELLAQENAG
jgi:heptosyltransferase-1